MDHEKIRLTLKSYIKDTTHTPERQKDAVQKMLFLEPQQFSELVNDVQDEISRRQNGNKPSEEINTSPNQKRNESRLKLSRLNNDKFKNLVLDVYLVFNNRFPDLKSKNVDEIEELICDLEKLITDLKGDMEYEQLIIDQLKKEDDYKARHHIFNKYVRRIFEKNVENTSVIDYMEAVSKETTHERIDITDLLETHVFMRHADHYFKHHNLFHDEYEYHKNNLSTLKDDEIFEKNTQDRLVRKTKSRIFEIMLQTRDKMTKKTISIENEVSTIIVSLERIKQVMKSNNTNACQEIGDNVLEASGSFLSKISSVKIEKNTIAELEKERSELNSKLKAKDYDKIPHNIFNIATIVKNILYAFPIGELTRE